MPLSSSLLISVGVQVDQSMCSISAGDTDSLSLDDPTPRVVKDQPLPNVENF